MGTRCEDLGENCLCGACLIGWAAVHRLQGKRVQTDPILADYMQLRQGHEYRLVELCGTDERER